MGTVYIECTKQHATHGEKLGVVWEYDPASSKFGKVMLRLVSDPSTTIVTDAPDKWLLVKPQSEAAVPPSVTPVEGAYYRQRNGAIAGPLKPGDEATYPWTDAKYSWTADGRFRNDHDAHDRDLVAQVWVSNTPPVDPEVNMPIRYIVHPGSVKSHNDGEWHFISAAHLLNLYGVTLQLNDPRVCVVLKHGVKPRPGDIHLYPLEDGDYSLPPHLLPPPPSTK